jgi:hypothetical protein
MSYWPTPLVSWLKEGFPGPPGFRPHCPLAMRMESALNEQLTFTEYERDLGHSPSGKAQRAEKPETPCRPQEPGGEPFLF